MYEHIGDFVADVYAFFDRFAELEPAWSVQNQFIKKAHLFDLGDEDAHDAYLEEATADIAEEIQIAGNIPLPFDNISMVMNNPVSGGWIFENISRGSVNPYFRNMAREVDRAIDLDRVYCITGYTHTDFGYFGVREQAGVIGVPAWTAGNMTGIFNPFIAVEFQRATTAGGVYSYLIEGAAHPLTMAVFRDKLTYEVATPMIRAAGISHPGHYIVEVKPKGPKSTTSKNPKKRRRAQRNIDRYILISHEEVTDLNPENRKPTGRTVRPHTRRAHWRTLPERAVHKRAQGITRVFVRPSLVGPRNFEDHANKYRVLPPVLPNVEEE
jgi:hypothetical protein